MSSPGAESRKKNGAKDPVEENLIGAFGLHGDEDWNTFRSADPDLAEAYLALVKAPRSGALTPLTHELIGLAGASACSGIDRPAIRSHVRAAVALGATFEQLREVIQLVSVQGIHTVTMGTPLVLEEAVAAGIPIPTSDTPEALEVRDEFILRRGYWSPLWDALVAFDPEFLRAYLNFSSLPWETGTLDAKTRELIYVAINSVTTHLFADGLKIHIRNALRLGATPREIVEVFEIVAGVGVRSALAALPIIVEECNERGSRTTAPKSTTKGKSDV